LYFSHTTSNPRDMDVEPGMCLYVHEIKIIVLSQTSGETAVKCYTYVSKHESNATSTWRNGPMFIFIARFNELAG